MVECKSKLFNACLMRLLILSVSEKRVTSTCSKVILAGLVLQKGLWFYSGVN